MSRWEFMRKLEELLSDISPNEREEALKYYNDYINDGGKDNEAKVLESLGTPEQVAMIIKDGLEGNAGEFTESGFKNSTSQNANPVVHYQVPKSEQKTEQGHAGSYAANSSQARSGMSGGMVALVIILCILFSPLILSLGGVLFGLIVSAFAVLFGFLLSFGIISIAFLATGITLVFVGLFRIFWGPLTGFAMISVGLILTGLGLLSLLLTIFIIVKAMPALFKGIAYLFGSIFGGKRGAK